MSEHHVLIVDDDEGVTMVLAGLVRQAGFAVHVSSSGEAALRHVAQNPVDVVLTDLRMPGMDGMTLLSKVKALADDLPVIMLTAHGNIETAVNAMRAGAADFLAKPFKREEVVFSLNKAITSRVSSSPPDLGSSRLLYGDSPAMQQVHDTIARAARSVAHVLIRGESGTGKEVAARSIHAASKRATGPFVAVNCAALPDNLLESELFGYEKGAFTGAAQRKPGRVALAEGGTLLLDEIGDVSPAVQVKLLRLLQEKEYEPLGATATRPADVRFIAATHQDLEEMVELGTFREDLYYRLDVVPLWMPPLRDRKQDIAALAGRFCEQLAAENERANLELHPSAVAMLGEHDWPGNVRELQNLVERLVVFCDRDVIVDTDVRRELDRSPRPRSGTEPPSSVSSADGREEGSAALADRRNEAEREAIIDALDKSRGNRTQAARLLGISRRTLYKRLAALAITHP